MRRFFLDRRLLKSSPPEEIKLNTRKRKLLTWPFNESCAFVKIRNRRKPLSALHEVRHRTKFSIFDLALKVRIKGEMATRVCLEFTWVSIILNIRLPLRDDSVAIASVDYHKSKNTPLRNTKNAMIKHVTIQTKLQTKPVTTRLYIENYLYF